MNPIRYEDLSLALRSNMNAGRPLAAHMVEDEDGLRAEHLTTVEEISVLAADGLSVYFCHNVCATDCEPGSVRLLMVEMPKLREGNLGPRSTAKLTETPVPPVEMFHGPQQRYDEINVPNHLLDVGKVRDTSAFADSVRLDDVMGSLTRVSPLERLSFLVGSIDEMALEVTAMTQEMEKALADQHRLEGLREWSYDRYRHAIHNGSNALAASLAVELFYIVTGLKPREDRLLFDMFQRHLSDAVLVHDSATLPPFQSDDDEEEGPDCGQ